jgi:hypothetical protein
VFGELAHMAGVAQVLVLAGSLIMIAGATAISLAEAPATEQREWQAAMERECLRYGLDRERVAAALTGSDDGRGARSQRRWWELLIVGGAVAIFVWLGVHAQRQAIDADLAWLALLAAAALVLLVVGGIFLWKRTRFG